MKNIPLGEVLLEAGYITDEQLQQVLDYQKKSQSIKRIGELLIELGYITEAQKLEALGRRLNYDIVNLQTYPQFYTILCNSTPVMSANALAAFHLQFNQHKHLTSAQQLRN